MKQHGESVALWAMLLLFLGVFSCGAGQVQSTSGQVIYEEQRGRELARELVSQLRATKPEQNFTNVGVLKVKPKRQKVQSVSYTCRVMVTETNWTSFYVAKNGTNETSFSVEHRDGAASIYRDGAGKILTGHELSAAFAGTDFWLADLGLEFFYWPEQRVLRWETKSTVGCKVLESRNPLANAGYSRVLSWIHDDSGGIVKAEAYDLRGKLLKEFRPTELEKINGRQELKEMEMENVQTESVTRLVFDLDTANR